MVSSASRRADSVGRQVLSFGVHRIAYVGGRVPIGGEMRVIAWEVGLPVDGRC